MNLKKLLARLQTKKISVEEAYAQLKNLPYEDLGFAKIDHHRHLRKGFPEVIYCEGKTPRQIAQIAKSIAQSGHDVLATRADKKAFLAVKKVLKKAIYHEVARIITVSSKQKAVSSKQFISIITAGTADLPVAEEAAVTAEFLGCRVEKIFDVGVAGIHRLLKNLNKKQKNYQGKLIFVYMIFYGIKESS